MSSGCWPMLCVLNAFFWGRDVCLIVFVVSVHERLFDFVHSELIQFYFYNNSLFV